MHVMLSEGGGGGSDLSITMTLTVEKMICEHPLAHLRYKNNLSMDHHNETL